MNKQQARANELSRDGYSKQGNVFDIDCFIGLNKRYIYIIVICARKDLVGIHLLMLLGFKLTSFLLTIESKWLEQTIIQV